MSGTKGLASDRERAFGCCFQRCLGAPSLHEKIGVSTSDLRKQDVPRLAKMEHDELAATVDIEN